MSNSDGYEIMSSDEDNGEPSRKTSCVPFFGSQKGYAIKRKVIDASGRIRFTL